MSSKRQRVSGSSSSSSPSGAYGSDEWEVAKGQGSKAPASPTREKRRAMPLRTSSGSSSDSEGEDVKSCGSAQGKVKNEASLSKEDKMTGLALPDVVRELLNDSNILRWDSRDGVYEVVNGDLFEKRFNELRKVRNKVKPSGTERPFSRMYNFFLLEQGDKWARTGTRFRPRVNSGFPSAEFLASIKAAENKKSVSNSASRSRTTSAAMPCVPRVPSAKPAPSAEPAPLSSRNQAPAAANKIQEQRKIASVAPRAQKSPVIRATNAKALPPREPDHLALDAPRPHMPSQHSMLGKRGRDMFHHSERILPRDMIEITARKLRLLERDHEAPTAHSYHAPVERESYHRHEEQEHYEAASSHEDHSAYPVHVDHHNPSTSGAVYSAAGSHGFHHMSSAYDVHDDFSDGMSSCMSSCVPSPETMMSLVGDFAGSPLDLGESELSSLLSEGPGNSKLDAHKEHHASFLFDAIDDSSSWAAIDW